MGFLDRLLGRETRPQRYQQPYGGRPRAAQPPADPDQAAIERYRYLLRTAPPEALEQAHAEAFAQLTPEQRRQVLEGLSAEVPPAERAADDDPRSLARMATRAELRQPGTLERSFGRGGAGGGPGMGMGMGGMIAGSLLASVAGAFVGTAIADSLFDLGDSGDAGSDAAADGGDAGADAGGDYGGGDVSADGGGWGDFGGGDFGGGDFGGGDF
ncbi:hypothetical protein [Cellulomonas pakistanensis]|uniref:DUF2076 domain-containing protein n=1 Tax=Cellulomonas pakistanensis TaxID=992287 RepID=A0A919PAD4_9CELL|nr:hypothetical protein [Cellulomonas pakistanensis]GIG36538.1 hypothetical protein Cpa01nite_19190 [Cellulomonas pakistanensis]